MKPDDYKQQASMVATDYMNYAVNILNERFGNGYAEEHPELIGSFMIASAINFLASQGVREISQAIEMRTNHG